MIFQIMAIFIPWKASSISCIVGWELFLRRAYMDMTSPGVQKPHCDPWALAIRSCPNTTLYIG